MSYYDDLQKEYAAATPDEKEICDEAGNDATCGCCVGKEEAAAVFYRAYKQLLKLREATE